MRALDATGMTTIKAYFVYHCCQLSSTDALAAAIIAPVFCSLESVLNFTTLPREYKILFVGVGGMEHKVYTNSKP